ncbi:MAG: endopeptidase La [Armatimonadetes bacterium]|nr:endopeptidase La [Armatimonadota bacterium]
MSQDTTPVPPEQLDLPSVDPIHLLTMPELVLFPGLFLPLHIEDHELIRTIDAAFHQGERRLAVVARTVVQDEGAEAPRHVLREVGCIALIPRMRRLPDGSMQLLLHGTERIKVISAEWSIAPATAQVVAAPVLETDDDTVTALVRTLQDNYRHMADLVPQSNQEMVEAVDTVGSPLELCYLLATSVRMEPDERYRVLAADDLESKLRIMVRVLGRELELLELGTRIQREAAGEMDKAQREYFLRQQLKAIRGELGEDDESAAAVDELRERVNQAALPEEADATARRELRRLEAIPPAAAEHHVIRTYLELILDLPWHTVTEDNLELKRAERILNEDHYGLGQVKERILEYLAVRSLKPDIKGPILCFVGPPGVGKTSLGKSIARALGRRFQRLSLGGVHDEAEIRGHRRTYIGAMPGRIIENLRRCGTRNPVFMLDELDKVANSFHGDPSSALLEVLDPAQNNTFRDNYLDLAFDLSQVLFIATANVLSTVQPALLDRLEVINIEGYTEAEKTEIARRYLIPRQVDENGLTSAQFALGKPALRRVISAYTRESGVRNLERTIGTLCRKAARRVAAGEAERVTVRQTDLDRLLGPEKVYSEVAQRTARPGVVTGLSVTATGGDVLFIEALKMPGKGQLNLTGQLGDVMRESAQAAFAYLRANAGRFGVPREALEQYDYHLHVPAGAIPKDGPSAGITMATALLSAMLDKPADAKTAMTGEITLTGLVLPIGGLKEKVLAARRAGIETVLLPMRNKADLRDLPDEVRHAMKLVPVERVDEVIAAALGIRAGR